MKVARSILRQALSSGSGKQCILTEGLTPTKIVLATAGMLTAAALTGCGGGSAGGHSDDYDKGYEIASHELVQSQVSATLAMGSSAESAAQGACEAAYTTYFALDSIDNKDDYIRGCVDAVKTSPN
jgi:hypothetical protein